MLLPPTREESSRLIEFFSESGYTLEGFAARPELRERASRVHGTLPVLIERTAASSAFHTLARWFSIGVSVPIHTARAVIPESAIELMIRCGMLAQNGNQIEPTVMMSPLGTMLIASDPVLKWEDDASDLILWPNPTTRQLTNFTIRNPFESALDMGSGSGVQAVGLATHCKRVVASDLLPRAAEFTRFNARLNGMENIECATGDSFESVGGRTFDLIVANPPFFITPSSGLTYCENNFELDLFCRRLAREAPAYLNELGYFQMVCEWVEIAGEPWRDRIAEWMDSSGCDTWVIKRYTISASAYGRERAHQRPPGKEGTFLADWNSYAHRNRIVAVHGGLVTMRKRSGSNWLRIDDEAVSLDEPIGDWILAGFATRDLLDSAGESALLNSCPQLAAEARLVQVLGQSATGWAGESLRLQLSGPVSRQIDVDPGVARFIAQLNGTKRLSELIRKLADETDAPFEQVLKECLAAVKRLLEKGFIEVRQP